MSPERISVFSAALRGWDAAAVARAARDAGIGGVEWAVGPEQAIRSPGDGAQAAAIGVVAAGLTVQDARFDILERDAISPYAALAAALGAPHVRVLAPAYRGGDLGAERAAARAALGAAAAVADAHGVALLVETSPGTLAPSAAHAMALLEDVPAARAGVLFDPGNTVIEGFVDPRHAIAELSSRLRHVHVKNVGWARAAGEWGWRHEPLLAGMLEWTVILAALLRAGYGGWLSIDHLAGGPSVAALERDAELVRGLLLTAARV